MQHVVIGDAVPAGRRQDYGVHASIYLDARYRRNRGARFMTAPERAARCPDIEWVIQADEHDAPL
jgi:hypothetical protein